MKNVLLVLLVLVGMSAQAEVNIGVVNIQKVLVTVSEGKRVMAELEKSFKAKESALKTEETKIKGEEDKYKKQASLLSPEARMTKEKDLNQMIVSFQNKTMTYQKDIQDMEAKLKKPILEKLRDVIKDVSEKQGVDFTVEISASPVVYAKKSTDITDAVIEGYNKKFK